MNSFRIALTVVVLGGLAGWCGADDSSAPPIVYTLEIDGQTVTLAPDEPLEVEGTFENPTLMLRVAQTRKLEGDGIAFDYPAYFQFESDTSDPDVRTWTVTGNDVTLMLFSFTEEVDPRTLAESTADALKAQDLKTEPVSVKLGDDPRNGVKATMILPDQQVIQQVLTLPPTDKGSRLLVVQEARGNEAGEAAELGAALKVVADSLTVARK